MAETTMTNKESLHLDQPLLSPSQQQQQQRTARRREAENISSTNGRLPRHNNNSSGNSSSRPRILDRDGTFAQSRGRWSVSNTRQRHHHHHHTQQHQHQHQLRLDENYNDDDSPAFFATSSRSTTAYTTNTTNRTTRRCCLLSPIQRLCSYLPFPCCFPNSYYYSSSRSTNNSLTPRRCWDDWFHTLSYTPTCILMLGVFIAYFVTIVVFAGLYLTVNKVGERYNNHGDIDNGGSGSDGGGGGGPNGAEEGGY